MKKSSYTSTKYLITFLLALFFVSSAGEATAQYFSFGKNRVQYKNFDWKYIQSEHFDVYYYQSKNYDLANFAAINLEASLKQISEDFGHQIADRIEVIIYDSHNDFSQTNAVPGLPIDAQGIGGATDLFKNRITMPFSGNYTEFRSTLQHELVHAVINDMFYGGSAQSLISGNVRLQIPLWFNEGLAEYVSNGWDTNSDMFVRDGVINDYMPPIPRLQGYLAYRGGQSVWNFIVEEYGRQKIREIMQNLRNIRNVESAFRRSLGLSIEELNERWKDYYRERYLPEVAEREQIGNFADLLTERGKAGTYNTSPALSPQGDKIAMITNARGFLDVVVINAITGEKIKTIIEGGDNIDFEELNILEPNLSWSPDGSKLTLSTKTKGSDNLAIVDYETGSVQKIKFPRLDAMGSVAWSPDGRKIAFDGSIGPFQDIFVYNVETREFSNVTNDAISDYEPAWSADSETIYFTSARGDNISLNEVKSNTELLAGDYLYTTDIYSVQLGSNEATRLTKTPKWSEYQAATTSSGRLIYINGIPNVYELNLTDRTIAPLTNLQTGVLQMSISSDGGRLAVNSINEGFTDIFMVRSPFSRKKEFDLSDNHWAQRRANETEAQRVPAVGYLQSQLAITGGPTLTEAEPAADSVDTIAEAGEEGADTATPDDTTAAESDTTEADSDVIDFRNYVFDTDVSEDSAFTAKYLGEDVFDVDDNKTNDGRFQPRDYRLKFSTDIVYAGGNFSTTFGATGLTQIAFSDLLGNHQITFGSNLVFDLRNSNYFLQYAYLKERTNWLFNVSHSSSQFQTFSGSIFRFRTLAASVTARYPFNKFRRVDLSLSTVSLNQDISSVGIGEAQNESSTFLYPQIIYTSDNTLPGFITPRSGSRYSVSLTGSPPLGSLTFGSVLGDFRKYFHLGRGYTFAVRGSGAASFGPDAQNFFLGGRLGWINSRFEGNSLPIEDLGDTFFTQPALPLRGYGFNAISGDRFALANAEFRFPLFAALLPGPIPILPLYNLTGVAFIDAGTAWGQDIPFEVPLRNGSSIRYGTNESDLDFNIRDNNVSYLDQATGDILSDEPTDFENNRDRYSVLPEPRGDILIGAGLGVRTILLGLPLRYDVGWPYFRDGFDGSPIHYISIGIDF